MDEDWSVSAKAEPFRLIRDVSPEEEAKKEGFVDIIVYNHWKKHQRRLYNKIKADQIKALLEQEQLKSIDELTDTLQHLECFQSSDNSPEIKDLISMVSSMRVEKMKKDKDAVKGSFNWK